MSAVALGLLAEANRHGVRLIATPADTIKARAPNPPPHPYHPPGDVPLRRWQNFIDDVGRVLDSPFSAVAAALGWGPYDLFGSDRDRPFARIDRAGLLWLLNGDKLLMLAQDAATIDTRTGARQTYRCKPSDPGRVLAWELTQ
jgi:hypothetical protein